MQKRTKAETIYGHKSNPYCKPQTGRNVNLANFYPMVIFFLGVCYNEAMQYRCKGSKA